MAFVGEIGKLSFRLEKRVLVCRVTFQKESGMTFGVLLAF